MAGDIVSAYVSNNPVRPADLPELIASVHAAVAGLASGQPAGAAAEAVEKPTPAQIRKSITPDALISFIDGKGYKTLKRHLTSNGLSPETYRERFGLPRDYPMVAAAYTERRSALARSIGLGRPGARAEQVPEPDDFDQAAPEQEAPKGRRRKAA
ncbi:MucR family transcriptional regulator [Methylobacterium sp. NEAU 140]|nr:MucR family transcriptional regulator [Methylobacterium sp. NEAU 140]MDP4022435.1 MucR family transcriptional regulator [Methylobacterium sp. NEAU 140]